MDPEKLKAARKAKVYSLQDLARYSGVHRQTIYNLEAGRRKPHPATVRKLADALGVDPLDLMGEDPD